jgi:Acetoacetate decarboxylase (ADC)
MLDHPLVPGPTSAVETGPWHYGADYISVYFKGNPSRLTQLLPPYFRVDDGSCVAYVCEIISVADSGLDMVSTQPERTIYREAAVGVKCLFGDREGIFYPVMWVTTEWSLLRGILNGYQKRLADSISLTKLHPLNPGLGPVSPGTRFAGFCVKGPERMLSLNVSVKKPGSPSDLPSFGATFGLRRFPRTEKTQAEVDEPVEILKSNSRVSDVWLGDGSVESALDIGDVEPSSGAVYRSGFTISGSKVLRS